MRKIISTSFIIGILGIISCNQENKAPETQTTSDSTTIATVPAEDPKKDLPNEELENKYLLTEEGLTNIKIGDLVKQHEQHLKKAVQENGEGSFPGYDLLDDNQEKIGFVFSKDDNNTYKEGDLIGYIEIYSPLYKTKEGIGVNSTFADVKKAYPNAETHGSEIEGRTSSSIGGLSFRLDTYMSTYEIDESKIKPSTKIIDVGILGAKAE